MPHPLCLKGLSALTCIPYIACRQNGTRQSIASLQSSHKAQCPDTHFAAYFSRSNHALAQSLPNRVHGPYRETPRRSQRFRRQVAAQPLPHNLLDSPCSNEWLKLKTMTMEFFPPVVFIFCHLFHHIVFHKNGPDIRRNR